MKETDLNALAKKLLVAMVGGFGALPYSEAYRAAAVKTAFLLAEDFAKEEQARLDRRGDAYG